MISTAFGVRFKGHLCAGVKTGFARKPILFRLRDGEEPFRAEISVFLASEAPDPTKPFGPAEWDRLARLECARAIKRTEEAYRKLAGGGNHMLRGVKSVERLIQLLGGGPTPRMRRGKRWKIVPLEDEKKAENKSCEPVNNVST